MPPDGILPEQRLGPMREPALGLFFSVTTAFPREGHRKVGQFFGVGGREGCPQGTCGGTGLELRPTFAPGLDILITAKGGDCLKIYLDLAIFLNFCVDFLLLLGTNRLSGFPPGYGRILPAAAFGALYSGACLIRGFRFLANPFWRIVSLALLCGIAFGWNPGAIRRCGIFLLLSAALGGVALGIGRTGLLLLLFCAAGVWILCAVTAGNGIGQNRFVPVRLSFNGKNVALTALRDTGNTLRDPVTGEQVLVIGASPAQKLTGLTREQLEHPLDTITYGPIPGLRLIPYSSVGGSGMLLGLRIAEVTVGKRKQGTVVAFAPDGLDGAMGYEALTGGV